MGWAVWLAVPVVVTIVVAVWAWWRARPARTPGLDQAMRAHREYLDALARPAQGTARVDQR